MATKRQSVIKSAKVRLSDGTPIGVRLECIPLGEAISLAMHDLPATMMNECMAHGLLQKLIDAAAQARSTSTGASATPSDKWAAIKVVATRLKEGAWNAPREGGQQSGNTLLFQAMCRIYPNRKPEDIKAWLAKFSQAQLDALAVQNPKVAEAIAVIRAERAADVEAPDLGDLEGDDEGDDHAE